MKTQRTIPVCNREKSGSWLGFCGVRSATRCAVKHICDFALYGMQQLWCKTNLCLVVCGINVMLNYGLFKPGSRAASLPVYLLTTSSYS
jgi:hypothetical protein